MKFARRFFPFVVCVSAALLVADASAQFGGIFGSGQGRRSGGNRGADTQGGNQQSRNERPAAAPDPNSYEQIEYRLSLLQEDLKLTGEQNGTWQTFAAKTRAYAGDVARERASGMRPAAGTAQGNGLQHIGRAVDAARNRLAALEEVESSSRALYESLAPEQRTIADMRIPAIIAPRSVAAAGSAGANLPDMGSGSRPQR